MELLGIWEELSGGESSKLEASKEQAACHSRHSPEALAWGTMRGEGQKGGLSGSGAH